MICNECETVAYCTSHGCIPKTSKKDEAPARSALKLALDYIIATNKSSQFWLVPESYLNKTVTALREALASEAMEQPAQQEPVAWRTFDGEGGYDYRTYDENEKYAKEWARRNPRHVGWVEPLYTSPPASKPLTDEQKQRIHNETGASHALICLLEGYIIEAAHGIKENT